MRAGTTTSSRKLEGGGDVIDIDDVSFSANRQRCLGFRVEAYIALYLLSRRSKLTPPLQIIKNKVDENRKIENRKKGSKR
jgi:hypothetical protein